jgi:tetratricopeptide (TPR) repeat protein
MNWCQYFTAEATNWKDVTLRCGLAASVLARNLAGVSSRENKTMRKVNPYHKWLGIAVNEQPANHYRLLGIDLFETDPGTIRTAADHRMALIAKYSAGSDQELSRQVLSELLAARACLLSAATRQAYEFDLRKQLGMQPHSPGASEGAAYPFIPDASDDRSMYSSRFAKRRKRSVPLLVFVTAIAVTGGLLVWKCQQDPTFISSLLDVRPQPLREMHRPDASAAVVSRDTGSEQVSETDQSSATPAIAGSVGQRPDDPGGSKSELRVASKERQPPDDRLVALSSSPNPAEPVSPVMTGQIEKNNGEVQPEKSRLPANRQGAKNGKNVIDNELPSLTFDSIARDGDEFASDPDASPEGKSQLIEVSRLAGEASKECVAVNRDFGLQLRERQDHLNVLPGMRTAMIQAHASARALDSRLSVIGNRIRFTNDPLNVEEDELRKKRDDYNRIVETNRAGIEKGSARVEALNYSLVKLDGHLRTRWKELNDCRRKWLEICRPKEKYARADYEGLHRAVRDWLLVDELWLDAYCWGSLAAYELGEYQQAAELVQKVERLRMEIIRSARSLPQIEATEGLVVLNLPGQRSRSSGLVQKAMTHVDRGKDWQTHFLAGRAAVELGRNDSKAKAYFLAALRIDPNCHHASYWLGRLQTTAADETVRDVDAGIALLESAWSRAGKRSWRISFALVQAYDAAKRPVDAHRQWETTLALTPVQKHDELKRQRGQ